MDIFNRQQQTTGGVFSTDRAVAAISSGSGSWIAALVQNLSAEYTQDFTELYELGSSNVYRVMGRPKGRMTIGRVIGQAGTSSVESVLFDACNVGGTMTIKATPSLCGAQPGSITMVFGGLFVISYGIQISVQSQLITENIALAYNFFQKTVT